MKSNEIPKLNKHLSELEECMQKMQAESRNLGAILENIVAVCQDEPDLLRVINRERGYFSGLRRMLDNFPLVRQMRRRLTSVEAKIRRDEKRDEDENEDVKRQAAEVRNSLEDVLRQFLR